MERRSTKGEQQEKPVTMADNSNTNPKERGNANDTMIDDDDVTVASGRKAKKPDYIKEEMEESTLPVSYQHLTVPTTKEE